MPASNVNWPVPLVRFPTLWPGQFGVPGTDHNRGERVHCTGEVFYVDPNFPGVSDQRDGTSPTDPLATVTAALAKCQPYRGDTVAVMASNYWPLGADATQGYTAHITEDVIVSVPGVRLVGVFPSSPVGVPWVPGTTGGTCITINAVDVLIEGFSFLDTGFNNATGIHAVWNGAPDYGDNLTVRHCHFNSTLDYGIRLTFSYYAHIYDNRFQGVVVTAINDETASDSDYILIHDNLFSDCANAIKLPGVSYGDIHANRIFGDGTGTNNFVDLTGGNANIVADNWLGCTIGEYDTTCSDATSGSWVNNHCENGDTTLPPV
jgi:hypothetical protein